MGYTGGLRARLIHDSIYQMLKTALGDLGWFDAHPSHLPVTFIPEPLPIDTEVPLNTLALADEGISDEDIELGTNLAEQSWSFFVDVYAENEAISLHLSRDVKDILQGRMPELGRFEPMIDIYDWTLATPAKIFRVEVQDVRVDKAHDFPQTWLRHWRSCQFQVVDTYENSGDPIPPEIDEGYGGY